jgi:hypothetical protein
MYRIKLEEICRKNGFSHKKWSELSGVSVDTIDSITSTNSHDEKYSPKVNTLEDLCKPLKTELWEIFYTGEKNLVALNSELSTLREERDKLLADYAVAIARVKELETLVSDLKDELLDIYRSKNKK